MAKNSTNEIIPYQVFNGHSDHFYLPEHHSSGYIYFLVSIRNKHRRVVGKTKNVKDTLININTGVMLVDNEPALRNWVVMGFISGILVDKILDFGVGEVTAEKIIFEDIKGISQHRQSQDFIDKVEERVTRWNECSVKPYDIRLVWSSCRDWFVTP